MTYILYCPLCGSTGKIKQKSGYYGPTVVTCACVKLIYPERLERPEDAIIAKRKRAV